jgi:acetylornithine/succinyldiaminopimelate/putrescine aminotransferase
MTETNFFLNHLGQTNLQPFRLEVDRAEGIYIYDKQGKAYMDMISGVAVNNIGHVEISKTLYGKNRNRLISRLLSRQYAWFDECFWKRNQKTSLSPLTS